MSLDNIEQRLYSSKQQKISRKATRVSSRQTESNIPKYWDDPVNNPNRPEKEDEEPHIKVKTVIFIGFGILVLIGVAVAAVLLVGINRGGGNVELVVSPVTEVSRGVPFDVVLNIDNQAEGILKDAMLTVHLPQGIVPFAVNSGSASFLTEPIGDIGGGSLAKKTFRFLPTGAEHSSQKLDFTLSYTTGGRTRFEVSKDITVPVGSSAITLDIEQPTHVLSGSSYEFRVKYKNISDFDFPEVVLEAKYPNSFAFESASFPPDSLNNYWRLGELRANSEGELIIKGSASGFDAARFNIPVTISASFLGKEYPLTTYTTSVSIAPSPINIQIIVNRKLDYVARIGDRLNYTVHYENNSGIPLSDVIVKASLIGELFDVSSLNTNGQLDSVTNTITWHAGNAQELKLVNVGESGDVSFDVSLANSFPIRRLSDKNFLLRVKAHIDSSSVPFYLDSPNTSAEITLDTKVAGAVTFDTQAFYRDAPSGIANAGTMPPKANTPTEYTIHWVIRNYATDIKDIVVRATLENGVAWSGIVKSNVATVPLYNERTQEIMWKIDSIPATKGIVSAPIEAIFQVRATPNITQIGGVQPLITGSTFQATDDFTGLGLSATDVGIATDLPDDKTIGQGGGIVAP